MDEISNYRDLFCLIYKSRNATECLQCMLACCASIIALFSRLFLTTCGQKIYHVLSKIYLHCWNSSDDIIFRWLGSIFTMKNLTNLKNLLPADMKASSRFAKTIVHTSSVARGVCVCDGRLLYHFRESSLETRMIKSSIEEVENGSLCG